MSDREKLLGIIVGTLLGAFAIFGIYRMVNRGIEDKRNEITTLSTKLKRAKQENLAARQAQETLNQFTRRSLPADPETAHRLYARWLGDQVEAVGIGDKDVRFDGIPRTKKGDDLKQLSYRITGDADIKQVTELFHRILSADNLHRIRSWDLITKKKGGDKMKLTMFVDALCMPDGGEPKFAIGEVDETKLARSLEEYEEVILQRNLFAPGNQAPNLGRLGTQTVELGKRFNHKVKAEDPDGHSLIFEIGEDAPEGMNISESGTLTWRPKKGDLDKEYEVEIFVADKGIPSKEDSGTLKVKVIPERVVEAPKEEEFDEAKLAVLTAIVQGARDPMPQMCVYLRSKDESQYLQQGDKIRIGKWRGEVLSVEPDRNEARLQRDDEEFILKLGEALSDAKPVNDKDRT